jgi:hypothetical protein
MDTLPPTAQTGWEFSHRRAGPSVGSGTAVLASLPFSSSHAEWIGLIVGIISLIGIGGVVSMLFCHRQGCFRRGRFRHGQYRLCHVHHPNVPSDGKITDEHIAAVKPVVKPGS